MPDSDPGLMTVFTNALERTDPADRAAYLDAACAGNTPLRQRVEALLAAHEGAGRFLEGGATGTVEPAGITRGFPDGSTNASASASRTLRISRSGSMPSLSCSRPLGLRVAGRVAVNTRRSIDCAGAVLPQALWALNIDRPP